MEEASAFFFGYAIKLGGEALEDCLYALQLRMNHEFQRDEEAHVVREVRSGAGEDGNGVVRAVSQNLIERPFRRAV